MNNILIPRNLDSRIEKQKRIDLQRIQEYIKKGSQGELDLEGTPLTKLPDNLIRVGGSLFIIGSLIEDLGRLQYVEGNLWATFSNLDLLPLGLRVNGSLFIEYSSLENRFRNFTELNEYMEERNIKVGSAR